MNEIVYPYCDYVYYPSNFNELKIAKGEFLDIERTIQFKARQIEMVSLAFQEGKIKDGDWFLVGDIFFPALEAIKYMAELQNIRISIAGFNYAGRSDANDFVRKLNKWSDYSELAYHQVCDIIFVGSEYHKNNVVEYFDIDKKKVIVTGYIWDKEKAFALYPQINSKEDYIIFPHRLSKEKGIDEFLSICNLMSNSKFIVTSSSNNKSQIDFPTNVEYRYGITKSEYYLILSSAKYYLSTAYQETFGYTLREALMYNCVICAPNRVCYKEMLPPQVLYNSINEVPIILKKGLIMNDTIVNQYSNNIIEVIKHLK
jgi:glycosyltransferase involved in cell wall biosynthesis